MTHPAPHGARLAFGLRLPLFRQPQLADHLRRPQRLRGRSPGHDAAQHLHGAADAHVVVQLAECVGECVEVRQWVEGGGHDGTRGWEQGCGHKSSNLPFRGCQEMPRGIAAGFSFDGAGAGRVVMHDGTRGRDASRPSSTPSDPGRTGCSGRLPPQRWLRQALEDPGHAAEEGENAGPNSPSSPHGGRSVSDRAYSRGQPPNRQARSERRGHRDADGGQPRPFGRDGCYADQEIPSARRAGSVSDRSRTRLGVPRTPVAHAPGSPGGSDWSWRWGSGGPGVQGLRGVPESNGKVTSKGTAVACLVLAALLVGWAAAAPYVMWGP